MACLFLFFCFFNPTVAVAATDVAVPKSQAYYMAVLIMVAMDVDVFVAVSMAAAAVSMVVTAAVFIFCHSQVYSIVAE